MSSFILSSESSQPSLMTPAEAISALAETQAAARTYPPLIALKIRTQADSDSKQVTFSTTWPASGISKPLRLYLSARGRSGLRLFAKGSDGEQRRLLRNVLVSSAHLCSYPTEHLVLKQFSSGEKPVQILSAIAGWFQQIHHLLATWDAVTSGKADVPEDSVSAFWWDGKANFGDAAGPWLIERLTGRHAINARSTGMRGATLSSIGSLFQMMNHKRVEFWGSGMLYEPNPMQANRLKNLEQVTIHAVRGAKTRKVLQQTFGWDVPEIYGDPALLFPRYLPVAKGRPDGKIAFLPHRQHAKYFSGRDLGNVSLLTVADDLRDVVTAIASASVCVSTSLHGVIFAQAYGVPWVWLNVQDDELKGGEFKFEDFFTTLDRDSVARYDASRESLSALSIEELAAQAALPETTIDLELLDEAFPLRRATKETQIAAPSAFSWSAFSGETIFVSHARAAYRKMNRRGVGRNTDQRDLPVRSEEEATRASVQQILQTVRDLATTGKTLQNDPILGMRTVERLEFAPGNRKLIDEAKFAVVGNASAQLALSELLHECGDLLGAEQSIRDVDTADAYRVRYRILSEMGRNQEAFVAGLSSLSKDPHQPELVSSLSSAAGDSADNWEMLWDHARYLEPQRVGNSPYRNPELRQQLAEFFSATAPNSPDTAAGIIASLADLAEENRRLKPATIELIADRMESLGYAHSAYLLRKHRATRALAYFRRRPPSSPERLRLQMRSYVLQGEGEAAVLSGRQVELEGLQAEAAQQRLQADAQLMDGNVEPLVQQSVALRQQDPFGGESTVQELLTGTKVALVGAGGQQPTETQLAAYDIVVRLESEGTIDKPSDILVLPYDNWQAQVTQIKERIRAGSVRHLTVLTDPERPVPLPTGENLHLSRTNNSLTSAGKGGLLQRALYELVQFDPQAIALFGVDLGVEADPAGEFNLLRALQKAGVLVVQDDIASVLQEGLELHLRNLENGDARG